MRKFQMRSRNNIPGVVQTRARPGQPFLPPAGVDLSVRRSAKAQPLACSLSYSPKVAIVGAAGLGGCAESKCRVQTGLHRCASVELVVVPDLSLLHDERALASDVDLAISLLYIVSIGVLTTTTARLTAAQGVPRRLLLSIACAMIQQLIEVL